MLLIIMLLISLNVISGRYVDPNCGWSNEAYRAVGDWTTDTESDGLMQPTNAQPCEYAVEIHGLKPDKQYHWRVVIGDSLDVIWGCVGRNGPDCQFQTPTGSIRLKIVGSFAYPLTSEVIDNSPRTPQSTSSKKVFAHYMVGFAYGSDQSFFDAQIKRAQAAGIDGFALNVGSNDWQPARVATALDAAKNNGDFVMFISFDMASLPFTNEALARFHSVANHPNYYKINGRPFYSTFAGENGGDDFWSNWKTSSGINPYFCPSWPNYPTNNLLQSHPVADCIFTWNAWRAPNSGPDASFDTIGDRDLLASARATNKQYMAPVAPWFATHVWGDGFSKNWIYGSETLLPERWKQIISLQPDFVEIITWNDYSESSYICSISDDLPVDMGGIKQMITVPQNMNHDGWLDLSRHYIQWYKNNVRPEIINDQFYWWYRIHSKNQVEGEPPQYQNDANDCIVIHSIVKNISPLGGQYTVIVDLNGSKTEYKITELDQTECIPFPTSLGYVTISLVGPDNTIWWTNDNNVRQQSNGNNFNAFVNSHSFQSP